MIVKINTKKFKHIVTSFDMFSSDFLKSLERAEKDYTAGRVKKVKSLKSLQGRV